MKEKDNIFDVPLVTDEEIKKNVGSTINCIDLTPFTALAGTLVGFIVIKDDEDFKDETIRNLILAVEKEYESTEELKDFILKWEDLIDIPADELESAFDMSDGKIPLVIDEDEMYLKIDLTKEFMDKKKLVIVPFTHCSLEAF